MSRLFDRGTRRAKHGLDSGRASANLWLSWDVIYFPALLLACAVLQAPPDRERSVLFKQVKGLRVENWLRS